MSLAFWYWLIMLIWFLFGSWWGWRSNNGTWATFGPVFGGNVLLFLLLIILGFANFGSPFAALVK